MESDDENDDKIERDINNNYLIEWWFYLEMFTKTKLFYTNIYKKY